MGTKRLLMTFGAVLLVLTAAPARSIDQGTLEIAPGRTVVGEYGALLPMPLSDLSWDPNSCISTPWCDRFTLKVKLPPNPEEFRLTVKLEWLGGPQLTSSNQCYLYLWDQPQKTGPVRDSPCVNDVASIDMVPIKGEYQLVVRNFTATESDGYRLKLTYA